MSVRHPLEELLNASAWDIMSAVQAGFRAIIDVKGKLAEYFLEREIARLTAAGSIEGYAWKDSDGQPDFEVKFAGQTYRLECKNIRSKEFFTKPTRSYKIEMQKTRNSKDGTPTRGYRFTEFDLLAACLFNHTGQWTYLFCRARDLAPRPNAPEIIKIMQPVPFEAGGVWKPDLLDVVRSMALE
jgi:hypothetical protein